MDFPIENGGSFHSYVSLPEGNPHFFSARSSFFWGNKNAHHCLVKSRGMQSHGRRRWIPPWCGGLRRGATAGAQTGQWKVPLKKEGEKMAIHHPQMEDFPCVLIVHQFASTSSLARDSHIYVLQGTMWIVFFFWSYVPFSGKCDSYSVKTPWAAGLDLEMLPDFTIFPQKWRGKSQESPNNYSGLIWFDSGPLFRFFCIGTSYESHPFIFDTPLLRSQSATDISMPKSCRRWSFPRRHGGRPQNPKSSPWRTMT